MAQKIGIIYATKSKMIRRIIVPDFEYELHGPLLPGESIYIIANRNPSKLYDLNYVELLIFRHTGVRPPRHVCSVTNHKGNIVGYVHADPEVDSIQGHTLKLATLARAKRRQRTQPFESRVLELVT